MAFNSHGGGGGGVGSHGIRKFGFKKKKLNV